uniref:C-type lectin domain-containing protein n=1 Tax=Poecilia mexicana TaxID=48701 RepID=A0A3B3X1V3_9TELE
GAPHYFPAGWTDLRSYPFWWKNQPDNGGNEDCAYMMGDKSWNDCRCNDSFYWACEKDTV